MVTSVQASEASSFKVVPGSTDTSTSTERSLPLGKGFHDNLVFFMFFEFSKMPNALLFVYTVFFLSFHFANQILHTPKEKRTTPQEVVLHDRGRHRMRGYIQMHPDRTGRRFRRLVRDSFVLRLFLSAPKSVWGRDPRWCIGRSETYLKAIKKGS